MNPAGSPHLQYSLRTHRLAVATLVYAALAVVFPARASAQWQPQAPPTQDYGQYAPDEEPGYNAQPQYQPQYPNQPYSDQQGIQPGIQPSYDQQGTDQFAGQAYPGPAPVQTQAPLNTEQLEQLVAPIALYPDTLVAQVLAAATYPAQVVDADHWRQAQGYASPEQIIAGANVQNWDPSIKALTAVPQALAEMDQNIRWTIALGNAYYNQPQDVLDVIQIMRQRAQAAGNLQSGPQESVNYDQGYIQLAPTNPQIVYVPMYNPWAVYGAPVAPYRGFSLAGAFGSFFNSAFGSGGLGAGGLGSGGIGSGLVRYVLGIAMSAFSQTPWGWLGWGLDWLAHNLLFHNSGYYSHSSTLVDWGLPHGGPRAPYYHGVMRANLPNGGYRQNGYRPNEYGRGGFNGNNRGYGYNSARDQAYGHQNPGYVSRYDRGPSFNNQLRNNQLPSNQSRFPEAQRYAQNGYAHPGMQAYNRAPENLTRPQQYNRSAPSYGSGFSGNNGINRGYAPRSGTYGGMQSYRSPSPIYGHEAYGGSYGGRDPFAGHSNSYSGGNYGGNRGFSGYSGKPEKSGSSHFFGGGGKAPKMPKAPKAEKSHGGGHSGGHSSGGGHGGHHH